MGLEVIGAVIAVIKTVGYSIAGGYFVKTGIQYVKDYKESVLNEKKG